MDEPLSLRCMEVQRRLNFSSEKVGECMVSKTKKKPAIVCSGGVTQVDCFGLSILYRYRWWWFRINPKILFPSLRKEHRKFIVVNGKRKGWGEIRSGRIPLSRYDRRYTGLRGFLLGFARNRLGLCLKRYERGYIYIAVGPYRYVVIQRATADGLYVCEVFDRSTEDPIGTLIFNLEFTEVFVHTTRDGVSKTLQVIAGYVTDTLIYSRAAAQLSRTIKINV